MSKKFLQKAGIDINIFSPHSTRSAFTTMTKTIHFSMEAFLKAGEWRSTKKFVKHYDIQHCQIVASAKQSFRH